MDLKPNPGSHYHPIRVALRQMHFQTRLLLTYTLLVAILAIVLGVLFYDYNARYLERNAVATYELVATRVSEQVDSLFSSMDFVMVTLLSDAEFKSALSSLANLDRHEPSNAAYFQDASDTIRADLMLYSLHRDYHSAIVFNGKGDFFSSNFVEHVESVGGIRGMVTVEWADVVRAERGWPVVVGPYHDPWNQVADVTLFGLARSIRGPDGDMGLIAVQNQATDLERLFAVTDSEYADTIAWKESGELLYASADYEPQLLEQYHRRALDTNRVPRFEVIGDGGERELVIGASSAETGVTTAVVISRELLLDPLTVSAWLTVGLTALIVLVSLAYNWFSSRRLTAPLRHVHARLEQTELGNLGGDIAAPHPNDELAAIDVAFQRLKARLDDAIRREIQSHTGWMQARLDSLQAQINPHFLFNVLTVIANRGLEVGDEEIGELCDGIASMLRYSTATNERSARISDELEHVRSYLYLMKKRLEDRLETRITIDPVLLDVRIPKIVLQQIVENSITHGCRASGRKISIAVDGTMSGDWWSITVTDDGDGFDQARLQSLQDELAVLRKQLDAGEADEGMEIGGLGLLNTYTRLHLFFDGRVIWRLENGDSGGARVTIGGPMSVAEGQQEYVLGSGR